MSLPLCHRHTPFISSFQPKRVHPSVCLNPLWSLPWNPANVLMLWLLSPRWAWSPAQREGYEAVLRILILSVWDVLLWGLRSQCQGWIWGIKGQPIGWAWQVGGGGLKQQPTDTVPFFPWIGDLVHCGVKRPANNGVIQSYENHPVWMFSLGHWTVRISGTGVLRSSVSSPDRWCILFWGLGQNPTCTEVM